MHWKIEPHEIMQTKELRGRFGSKQSLARSQFSMDSLIEERGKQVFVTTVYYKGNAVAKKTISIKNTTVNRSLMMELKYLKDLQHNHLARFVGACLEEGNEKECLSSLENAHFQTTPFF